VLPAKVETGRGLALSNGWVSRDSATGPSGVGLKIQFTGMVLLGASVLVPSSQAQGTQPINADTAGHEVEFFGGAGIAVDGFYPGRALGNAGVRYGWMLTDRHGHRFFSNRFEYAVALAPVFVLGQPGGTAYGFNFDAVTLKWNFAPHGHIAPFVEIEGGAVVTNRVDISDNSKFNFVPAGTIGVRLLHGKYFWSIGARWLHVSDANLTPVNPGENTVGFRIGFGRWLK
jgi:Lipid A 3-O-deacylase (PagL)